MGDVKFEPGQKWRTRGGKVVVIRDIVEGRMYPLNVVDESGRMVSANRENGREWVVDESENDLVSLITDAPPAIAPGWWLTKGGKKVCVHSQSKSVPANWIVETESGSLYCVRADGNHFGNNAFSLDRPWTEPRTFEVHVAVYRVGGGGEFVSGSMESHKVDAVVKGQTVLARGVLTLTEGDGV